MTTGTTTMHGKTVLITGATSGIGKATATELAKRGATILAVGRDPDKGAAAVAEIRRASGNEQVELLLTDLASLREVRRLAETVQRRTDRLDVLINNAGGMWPGRIETPDGYEMMFAVNHLAPFLLTNLLLPTLQHSAPARIISVSSGVHAWGRINFDNLQRTKWFHPQPAYWQAKLAVVLFIYELARRLNGTNVTANVLEPGMANTPNMDQLRGSVAFIMRFARPFISTPEQGAQTSIYLASSPEVAGVTGKYFSSKQQPVRSARASYDVATAERLWRVSETLTGLTAGRTPQAELRLAESGGSAS